MKYWLHLHFCKRSWRSPAVVLDPCFLSYMGDMHNLKISMPYQPTVKPSGAYFDGVPLNNLRSHTSWGTTNVFFRSWKNKLWNNNRLMQMRKEFLVHFNSNRDSYNYSVHWFMHCKCKSRVQNKKFPYSHLI